MSHWDVRLSRLVQDWELEPLVAFMELIYSKPIRGEGMEWIDPIGDLPRAGVLRFEVIITSHPHLIACLSLGNWCVIKGPTQGGLLFLGCFFREDFIHWESSEERYYCIGLVLHVQKVWGVYGPPSSSLSNSLRAMENDVFFFLFGLQWIMPKRVIDLFTAWQGSFVRHKNIAFWKAVPYCILWFLWRSFEGYECSILDVKTFFFCTLLDWGVAFHSFPCFTLKDMIKWCGRRKKIFI